jgi:hypothetical protein
MKRTGADHPKIYALADSLGIEVYGAVGLLELLWHFTARHARRGDIGRWEDPAIARALGWPREDATRLIRGLVESRWVDVDEEHRLIVHDWRDHADESVKKTLRNRGETFVSRNGLEKSRIVLEKSRTSNDGSRNGEPKPEPEPKPKPKPEPEPEPSPPGTANGLLENFVREILTLEDESRIAEFVPIWKNRVRRVLAIKGGSGKLRGALDEAIARTGKSEAHVKACGFSNPIDNGAAWINKAIDEILIGKR